MWNLRSEYAPFDNGISQNEEIPLENIQDTIVHVVPDATKSRWNHIEDLDTFFKRIYIYHQSHGYTMLLLKEALELFQFKFIVIFTIVIFNCVDYKHLFDGSKKNIVDVFRPIEQLNLFITIILPFAIIIWLIGLIRFIYHIVKYYDIKQFYNIALKIDDSDLSNHTWNEVQKKLLDVQTEQQMCVHKQHLSELDIYHRVLRIENYLVAMFNKNLIQEKICIPFIGEVPCITKAILYNIEMILFRGPFAPFENNWYLLEDYKNIRYRHILARKLIKQITAIGIINIIFAPLIFAFLIVHTCLNYGMLFKRDPSVFTTNCWSKYGKWYLRHFNELDHELFARLKRAHKPATKYMGSFASPLIGLLAKNIMFFAGAILSILVALVSYDEDVLHVGSLITMISVLSMTVFLANKTIPDENLVFFPEQLLTTVLAHVHYLPNWWRGKAHTSHVRKEFSLLFQSRLGYMLTELLSPILTPYILLYHIRPRSLDIIDFIRNFTVSVVGVGDICSFAQMDVRKHGNPDWHMTNSSTEIIPQSVNKKPAEQQTSICETNQYTQGENGKTELSLFHFTLTNPEWKMPEDAKHFVAEIKDNAIADVRNKKNHLKSTIAQSLIALGNIDHHFSMMTNSILLTNNARLNADINDDGAKLQNIVSRNSTGHETSSTTEHETGDTESSTSDSVYGTNGAQPGRTGTEQGAIGTEQGTSSCNLGRSLYYDAQQSEPSNLSLSTLRRRNVSKQEGKCEGPSNSILKSLHGPNLPELDGLSNLTTADMCLSTLFLYDINQKQVKRRGHFKPDVNQQRLWHEPHQSGDMPSQSSSVHKSSEKASILEEVV